MDIAQAILSTLVIQVAAGYYISNKTLKWKEAVRKCNMAVPDLHPTQNGFNVSITYDVNNGDVWLGYFMKMTVFDYIGCVKLYNMSFSRLGRGNSPGLCFTFCKGKEMIGVSNSKCICVDTLENYSIHETGCKNSCRESNKGVACGGYDFMSVYKVNKTENSGSRETPCLSFEQYGQNKVKKFTWETCSSYHPEVCKTESNNGANRPNYPWLRSINECFKKGLLPASYQDLRQTRPNTNPFWSGVISSDVIYTYTEWNRNIQGVRFGYMSANRSVYFIDTDEPRFVLCNSTPTKQDKTLSTLGTSSTNPATNTAVKIEGQDVSVIIGVSVSVCVIIIAAVAAFIVLRRRGKIPNLREVFTRTCCKGQDAMMKDNVEKPSTVIKNSTPETVNSKQECNNYTDNAHTYLELEPSNSDHNMHDMNSHERNEPTENGNIYNEIETESYTYAHVDKKKTSSLDDDYDTTETTAKNLKRKADNINGDYAELENNTYNHIDEFPTSLSTDQTYNIPHHDDSQSKTDEDHDGQDTYSHINNKQSDGFSNNPDSVYNTTNAFKD